MRSSVRFWLALSLMLAAGGIVLWFKGRPEKSHGQVAWAHAQPQAMATQGPALLSAPSVAAALGTEVSKPENPSAKRARYQLKNVDQPIEALTRVDSAILMRNALIDTRQPVELPIPADLRAGENPGAYIVQAENAPTAEFQNALKAAGATIVAYVPNNAFLVKAGSEVTANLQGVSGVRSVLPYEPYYKIDTRLMKFAVDHEAMADDAWLRVTLFPGVAANAVTALAKAIGPTEKSPFGQQVLIQPRPGVLAELAQLAEVQIIEPVNARVVANDLTRVTLGVSADTVTNANYFGLSGKDVWVNVNDIGVDSNHPALAGRVFYYRTNGTRDIDGHGTHVAGSIVGVSTNRIFDHLERIGTNSSRTNMVITTDEDGNTKTNLYVDGSLTNADFRGIAHEAKLFVLPIDYNPDVNEPVTDTYLIETAARTNYFTLKRTNETLISNNSWNYADTPEYDSQAARFDAATRDALPDDESSQPVLYVFAAGNMGFGGEDGQGGEPGTIASPGSAKNVITVGALEAPRFIAQSLTNVEERTQVDDDGTTNTVKFTNYVQVFRPTTDSANEVASYSSRGNVGIGVEGPSGRFKPDLVAPGTFIMSARSKDWNLTNDFDPTNTNLFELYNVLSNLNAITSGYRYDTGTSFSAPGVSGMLALVQEFFSHKLPADRRRNLSPALMKALMLNSARSVNSLYDWNPLSQANFQGWGMVDLRNLITAAEVPEGSPAIPTLQQMTESDWPLQLIEQSATNAVATGEDRVWNITVDTNALGLPLRFTLVWTDPPGNPQVGVKLVNDLDLTVEVGGRVFHGNDFPPGVLVTESRDPLPSGESAINDPFRDTVNNVEKIVIGTPTSLVDTNGQPARQYKVKVSGRRVNVKSVSDYYTATGRTNEIVQDFALVISADNYFVQKPFQTIARDGNLTVTTNYPVQAVYNGLEATNQRSGANSPLYLTNGNMPQWRFYVFTNSPNTNGIITNVGRYVTFITSGPLNVGKPRNLEPDVDIYVSKDRNLTNLDTAVLSSAWKSTTRLGTEQVVFGPSQFIQVRDGSGNFVDGTNRVDEYDPAHPELGGVIVNKADIGDVFYIGVKAEDQQAGEFSFIAISSQDPLEEDRNGVRIIHMLPAPTEIPDGTPNIPNGRRYYGIPMRGGKVLDASTYFYVEHEELGDLVGSLGHGSRYATLNNHSLPNGFTDPLAIVYSSSPYMKTDAQSRFIDDPAAPEYPPQYYVPGFPSALPPLGFQPDGPVDLSTFITADAMPVWTFDMVDSAASHVGRISQAEVHVRPLVKPLISGEVIGGRVAPGGVNFYPIEVPIDASKVTITLTLTNPPSANTNILMLVGRDILPSTNHFDYFAGFSVGGPNVTTLTFDLSSQPPLIPGEYIVAIVNLGTTPVDFTLSLLIESDNSGAFREVLGNILTPLTDDARTTSDGDFLLDRIVTDASVAIFAPNIRESDYVFRLTSPQGTSVILSENRGGLDQGGFGSSVLFTNAAGEVTNSYAVFTDHIGSMIKFTPPPFSDSATSRGLTFSNSFEGALEGTYTAPTTLDGWRVTSNQVYAVWGDAAQGNIFANLGNRGAISNTLPTVKGRPYKLSFSYRGKASGTVANAAADFSHTANPNGVWTYGYRRGNAFVQMPSASRVSFNPPVWLWQGTPAQPPLFGEPTIGKNEGTTTFVNGGTTFYRPGEFALHPGPTGEHADLRWTAPSAGTYQVVASFRGSDQFGSTDVHIEVNGVQVFTGIINGNGAQNYTFSTNVSAGGVIDFMVGSNGRYENDTTITSVTITSPFGGAYSTGQVDVPDGSGMHTNLPPGAVDRHFRIVSNPDPNFAPPPGQDGSEVFVADPNTPPFPAWFANDRNSQWLALKPQNDAAHPAGLYTNRTSFVLTGVNPTDAFVRARIAADDGISAIRVNNVNMGTFPAVDRTGYSTPFDIRGFRAGLNTIDFVVNNSGVGSEGFRADLSLGVDVNRLGQLLITNSTTGFLRLTSSTNSAVFPVSGGPLWQRFDTEFIAPTDNMGIEFFAGALFPGVDIDDVVLEDTGTKFLIPEEPLDILRNERAMGQWKLEAIDNRTGGVNPSVILDWYMILGVTPSPRLAEALESSTPYPTVIHHPVIKANTNVYTPGRILAGETEYFYFDVCDSATEARIQLSTPGTNSIQLELLVDRSGFPTGDPDHDDYAIVRTTARTNSTVTLPLTLQQPIAAPLQPGKRLFIAVRAAQFPPGTNETFTLQVQGANCGPILPIPLRLNESVSSASFAGSDGTSYQAATNTTSVNVTAQGTLTLVAANGAEPTLDSYQIKQTISGSLNIPLPTAGSWFFRIINESGDTVPYTITASAEPTSTIRNVSVVDNHLTVTWQSEPGASYEIATSRDLVNWTTVTTVQATSTESTYNDPEAVSGTMKFIRIRKL